MAKPIVAVVGRPNVGKSTLFNKLCGKRLSIVDDTPGVTRDRIFGECEWVNRNMILVDTGGIEPYSDDIILSQMRRQAQLAIDSADVQSSFAMCAQVLLQLMKRLRQCFRKAASPLFFA